MEGEGEVFSSEIAGKIRFQRALRPDVFWCPKQAPGETVPRVEFLGRRGAKGEGTREALLGKTVAALH